MAGNDAFSLRIPGNALLAGEFAILNEGGKGIILAVDRYAVLKAERSDSFSFTGRTGKERILPKNSMFLQRLTDFLWKTYGSLPSYSIELDSSALYYRDGRKCGLGSSAVTALALTAAFQRIFQGRIDKKELLIPAIEAHRAAQQGQGSGYDVAASCFGGIQLFTGGFRPQRESIGMDWLPSSFSLVPGPGKTATSEWVDVYRKKRSSLIRDWPDQSNRLVEKLINARNREEGLSLLQEYKTVGDCFLRELGYPELPAQLRDKLEQQGVWKNLGAGYELIAQWKYKAEGEEVFQLAGGFA